MLEPKSIRLSLRPATQQDWRCLWDWRNDPATREASFDTAPIPLQDHKRWLARKLEGGETRIFIVLDADGRGIGYVRFDIREGNAEISVSVDRGERGKGYGAAAIRHGCERLLATEAIERVIALVKGDNPASLAAFKKAGFVDAGVQLVADTQVHKLVYEGTRSKWRAENQLPRTPVRPRGFG